MLALALLQPLAYVHSPLLSRGPAPQKMSRVADVTASAKILPVVDVGLGVALLRRAASATGAEAAVLASAGGLAIFNLAATDNARFASAKRAVKVYEGKVSLSGQALEQRGMAFQWYTLVRLHVFAQVVALACMARASTATLVLQGATAFMGANVAFFLGGAGAAKHDENGMPAPIKPGVLKFVLAVDSVLLAGAAVASLAAAGTTARAVGSYLFAGGCLIGVAEGLPKSVIGPFKRFTNWDEFMA